MGLNFGSKVFLLLAVKLSALVLIGLGEGFLKISTLTVGPPILREFRKDKNCKHYHLLTEGFSGTFPVKK